MDFKLEIGKDQDNKKKIDKIFVIRNILFLDILNSIINRSIESQT